MLVLGSYVMLMYDYVYRLVLKCSPFVICLFMYVFVNLCIMLIFLIFFIVLYIFYFCHCILP